MLFTQKETTNSPSLSMICRSLNCRVFCNALSNISFNYFTWNNYQLLRHPTDSSAHQMPQLMSLVNSTHILSMLMPMTVQNSMSAWTESLQESKDVSLVWSTMNSQSSVMPQKMYLNGKDLLFSIINCIFYTNFFQQRLLRIPWWRWGEQEEKKVKLEFPIWLTNWSLKREITIK